MDAGKIKRAEEIFQLAVERPVEERESVLNESCAGDAGLRAFVDQLLSHDATGMGEFLCRPVFTPSLEDDAHVNRDLPARIGRYELVRRIGEGGMGVVYEARQKDLQRTVALKVIRSGLPSRNMLRRFQHEAEVLAQLHHPGIAHIYEAATAEVGTEKGVKVRQPFFAMEFIEGERLNDYASHHNLGTRERLDLVARICDAVQHAHQKGVIHRDLKPGNVLVDETGQPKILDFGVARATDADMQAVTTQTDTGQLIGTVPYMSPEQVTGDSAQLDTRSDVYSLGVMLYELLSGRLPHDVGSRSIPEAARRIREEEPARLASINKTFRGEIETIVVKALEKDKTRRYQSASDLAGDIRRYLRGEPIEAKRDSALYVLGKNLRRHRVIVTATTVVLVLLAAFGVLSSIQAERNRELAAAERAARLEAVASKNRADREAEKLRRSLYFSRIGFAQAAYSANDLERMRRLLEECPSDLRGWEWSYLLRLSDQSSGSIRFDQPGGMSAAFSRGARTAVTSRFGGQIQVWDTASGRRLQTIQPPAMDLTLALAVSPDGQRIVAGANRQRVVVYDAANGRVLSEVKPLSDQSVRVSVFSPDGARVFTGGWDPIATIWDMATGRVLQTIRTAGGTVNSAAFRPDGSRLAVADKTFAIGMWDTATGEQRQSFVGHTDHVQALAFSPDGRRLASGSEDCTVRIWDVQSGAPLAVVRPYTSKLICLAFSPNGKWIASGSTDTTIKVLDASTGNELRTLRGHTGAVHRLAFNTDGTRLFSAARDGTLRWWDEPARSIQLVLPENNAGGALAFSPDGTRLTAGGNGQVSVWDVASGRRLMLLTGFPRGMLIYAVSYSPDGKLLAVAAADGKVKVWDATTGESLRELHAHDGQVYSAAFSPDGRWIASAGNDKFVKIWDANTGDLKKTLVGHAGGVTGVAWMPDGTQLVSASTDRTVRLWDVETARTLCTFKGHTHNVYAVAVVPDGQKIVSAGEDGTVRVWSALGETEPMTLHGHRSPVYCVAINDEGSRVVSGGFYSTARLWDLASGQEILTLRGHVSAVTAVAFSPGGDTIATADDHQARLWKSHGPH
ncbi:MAG: protein kinase [Phycisphaerae bacterium]